MNVKQAGLVLLILVALAALAGWWASRGPVLPAAVSQEHVLAGEQRADGSFVYTEDEPYYTVEAEYPGRTPLEPAADARARLTIEQELKARIDEFKRNGNFDTLTAEDIEIQGIGTDRKYALGLEYKEYTAAGYHSYLYTIYEDMLGAHPNGYYLTFVFDKEGAEVGLSTLFPRNPNWLEELSLLVSNSVSAQMKDRTGEEDVTELMYAEGVSPRAENFSNFVIDGSELVVFIPPYQVAAYAMGSFEVRVPLSDLQ